MQPPSQLPQISGEGAGAPVQKSAMATGPSSASAPQTTMNPLLGLGSHAGSTFSGQGGGTAGSGRQLSGGEGLGTVFGGGINFALGTIASSASGSHTNNPLHVGDADLDAAPQQQQPMQH